MSHSPSEPASKEQIQPCPHGHTPGTCRTCLHAEIARLQTALASANANHERFEREWYLRGDEIERLREDDRRWENAHKILLVEIERLKRPWHEREAPHCANCSCPPHEPWQPIETAPTEGKAIYWIVPLPAEETYRDSSGNPVVAKFEPYAAILLHRGWSSLSKATHWMPIPRTPSQPPGAVPE